jgi:hypothetical protein
MGIASRQVTISAAASTRNAMGTQEYPEQRYERSSPGSARGNREREKTSRKKKQEASYSNDVQTLFILSCLPAAGVSVARLTSAPMAKVIAALSGTYQVHSRGVRKRA